MVQSVKGGKVPKVKTENEFRPWTAKEDKFLENELRSMISEIADAHGRSSNSIATRIRINELLYRKEYADGN